MPTDILCYCPLFLSVTNTNLVLNVGHSFSDVADAEEWMILNVQEMGFFKVNYDRKNWNLLIKQLQEHHAIIHPINRAQVLSETMWDNTYNKRP